MLKCLATWGDANDLIKLVDSVLENFEQENLDHGGFQIEEKDKKDEL